MKQRRDTTLNLKKLRIKNFRLYLEMPANYQYQAQNIEMPAKFKYQALINTII